MDITIAKVIMEVDFFSAENFLDMLKSGAKGGVTGLIGSQVQALLMKAFNIKSESEQILAKIQEIDQKITSLTDYVKKARKSDLLDRYVEAADQIHQRVVTEGAELSKRIEPTDVAVNQWKKFVEPDGSGGWKEHYLDPFIRSYTGAAQGSSPFTRGTIETNLDIYSNAMIEDCTPVREYVETLRALHTHFAGHLAKLGKLVERTAARLVELKKLTPEQAQDKVQTAATVLAEAVRNAAYMMYDTHPPAFELYTELWINPPDPRRYYYFVIDERAIDDCPGALADANETRGDFRIVRHHGGSWHQAASRWRIVPVDPAQDLIRIQNLAKGGKRTLRVKPRSGQSMTVGASYNDNKYMVDLGDEAGADDKWRLVIGKRPHVTIQNTANNNAIEVRKRGVARDADIGPLFVDWRPRVTTGRWRILQMSDGRVLSTESRPDRSPYAMCESELVGGSGGGPFDDLAQLDFRPEGVAKIRIWTNENCISAIQISYRSPDGGKIFECPRRGSGGHETAPFELAPHETIVEMDITGDQLLRWVQFKTNRSRSSPAYGHGRAGALVKLVTGEVLGFFGRSGLLIDALGAYLAPK